MTSELNFFTPRSIRSIHIFSLIRGCHGLRGHDRVEVEVLISMSTHLFLNMFLGSTSGFDSMLSGWHRGRLYDGGIAWGRSIDPPISSFLTFYNLLVIPFSVLGHFELFVGLHGDKLPFVGQDLFEVVVRIHFVLFEAMFFPLTLLRAFGYIVVRQACRTCPQNMRDFQIFETSKRNRTSDILMLGL